MIIMMIMMMIMMIIMIIMINIMIITKGRPAHTFALQEEAEHGAGHGDGPVVVVIVVDGQQVALQVGVAHQQLHVGDAVHVLQQPVELIVAARLGAVQGEPAELSSELGEEHTQT